MIRRSNNCSTGSNYCATNLPPCFTRIESCLLFSPQLVSLSCLFQLTMLFCKPSRKAALLYEKAIEKGQTLAFRSLHPKHDLPVTQHWLPYCCWNEFWHFPTPQEHPGDIYTAVQKNPNTHAIVGLLDGQLICQIDLILAEASDLGKHIQVSDKDCVARFLFIQPPIVQQVAMAAFLSWYFGFSEAGHLYTIPGIQNHTYCRMLESVGFIFYRNCILTHQAASIYRITNAISSVNHYDK